MTWRDAASGPKLIELALSRRGSQPDREVCARCDRGLSNVWRTGICVGVWAKSHPLMTCPLQPATATACKPGESLRHVLGLDVDLHLAATALSG